MADNTLKDPKRRAEVEESDVKVVGTGEVPNLQHHICPGQYRLCGLVVRRPSRQQQTPHQTPLSLCSLPQ